MSEETIYKHILSKLEKLDERLSELSDKVDGINDRLDDDEYQRYAGGVR